MRDFPLAGSAAGVVPLAIWDSNPPRFIKLVQGRHGIPLRLRVHSFKRNGALYNKFSQPSQKLYDHCFGVLDLDEAEISIREYIKLNSSSYILELLHRDDPLCKEVFQMAYNYGNRQVRA
jgi:hypothetical protein